MRRRHRGVAVAAGGLWLGGGQRGIAIGWVNPICECRSANSPAYQRHCDILLIAACRLELMDYTVDTVLGEDFTRIFTNEP